MNKNGWNLQQVAASFLSTGRIIQDQRMHVVAMEYVQAIQNGSVASSAVYAFCSKYLAGQEYGLKDAATDVIKKDFTIS